VSRQGVARGGGFAIAVMAKAPVPGRVKTRLVPPLTAAMAAALSTGFLRDITENIVLAARKTPMQGYVAYAPPGSAGLFAGILAAGTRLVLADGAAVSDPGVVGFGRCLLHAARSLFALGHSAICLLNSDSPNLPTALLAQAAAALAKDDDRVVLGPVEDGGYYMLGMKSPHPYLFEHVDWSTSAVAAQTRERARALGLGVVELDPWYDVDDADGLRRLCRELSVPPALNGLRPFAAPATADCIARLDLCAIVSGSRLRRAARSFLPEGL
jgi:rSAM/selenodomain-associated transferase 1